MDDLRHDIRSALEAEWGRQPAPDLGLRAVDHAFRNGRQHRRRSLSRVVATAVAVVLGLAVIGTLTYIGRLARPSVPAGSPAPTPVVTAAPATPSPSPTPAGPPAFAVLSQPIRDGRPVLGSQATVSIVDATGRVLTSATFDQAPRPNVFSVGAVLQSPVRVAAGAVFYADANGVVRRLGREGRVTAVATFPVTRDGQQELSFAVSPDGRRLMASVLTLPPMHVPPPQQPGDPVYAENGHWSLELFTADAGQPAVSTFRRDLGTSFPNPTMIVGWDAGGPLATLNTGLGSQQQTASLRFNGDTLVHIAPDGTHLDQVAGGCRPLDEVGDGTVLCAAGAFPGRYEIRRSSGELVWQRPAPNQLPAYPYLSPDATHVAYENRVVGRDGRTITLGPPGAPAPAIQGVFRVEGWLDDRTVIGSVVQNDGSTPQLFAIDLGSPGQLRRLQPDGQFVAAL